MCVIVSRCGFNLHSLIANDVEHFFMSLLVKCLFKSFVRFLIGLFSYSLVLRVLFLFSVQVLVKYVTYTYFLLVGSLSFYIFKGLLKNKTLFWRNSINQIFSLFRLRFWCHVYHVMNSYSSILRS